MKGNCDYLVNSYGMPPKVARGIEVLRDLWPYNDGPAHIVHADFNLTDSLIGACISSIDHGDTFSSENIPAGDPVYAATRAVLVWLLENTTEAERTDWLANY